MTNRLLLLGSALCLGACTAVVGEATGDEATQEGNLVACLGPERVEGIDVSVYQGRVDWPAVRAGGRAWATTRIGDGLGRDARFAENWEGMRAAGLVRGGYHFFRIATNPEAQAQSVVAAVGRLGPGDLPVVADLEDTGAVGTSKAQVANRVLRYLAAIEAGTGKTPLIYTAGWWWNPRVGSAAFGRYPLIVAQYSGFCPSLPLGWSTFWGWQYRGDAGRAAGVVGPCDLDWYNGSLASLRAFSGLVDAPTPPPVTLVQRSAPLFFTPASPTRLVDTRAGQRARPGEGVLVAVPDGAAQAVAVNVVAVGAAQAGYWVASAPSQAPATSNGNFAPGAAVAGFALVAVEGARLKVSPSQEVDLVVDHAGDFSAAAGLGLRAVPARRLLDTRDRGQKLAPGEVLRLDVQGDAAAAVLNLTATEADVGGFVAAWPCALSQPGTSSLNARAGSAVANAALVGLSQGAVCLTASAPMHVVVDLQGVFVAGGAGLVPVDPVRVVDTRSSTGLLRLEAGATARLSLGQLAGWPADAQAAALQVTSTESSGAGFITVVPCGEAASVSALNPAPGRAVGNLVHVAGSEVCFTSNVGTDLVVDVLGVYR